MVASSKRILLWTLIFAAIAIGIGLTLLPQPVTVDLVTLRTAPMRVTVDEEGETRIHDLFVLSAPVAGRVRRIEAHAGDEVVANDTVVALIEPGDPTFLDPRSEVQARAAVRAAESAQTLAASEVELAQAELEFAQAEHRRARELIAMGTITRHESDAAERAFKTARAALATAQAGLEMRTFELEQARAQLLSPAETQFNRSADCPCVVVRSPVTGRVLRIINASERIVQSGEPLVEIGDPRDLEIATDYLSTDAVQIQAGQPVIIDNWGGQETLSGVVRSVEPYGFKKISALGIEEQRVNVIIDLTDTAERWSKLGHGYQVETRVVIWESPDALSVPLTALFRDGNQWAVFTAEQERAVLRHVTLGRRNGLLAEVASGLDAGSQVVVHPSNRVVDGVRLASRR